MSVALPTAPGPATASPSYIDYGGVLRPIMGGPDQKLNRLGNRFACEFNMPPMPSATTARAWVAALIQAQRSGAIIEWPQPDFDVGSPGSPVVDGAGQSGLSLFLRSATPGYAFQVGQFISVASGGRHYLHVLTSASNVNVSGQVGLSIEPMMRVSYADGALIDIDTPMIEGFVEGNSRDWTIDMARNVGLSFRIVEAE